MKMWKPEWKDFLAAKREEGVTYSQCALLMSAKFKVYFSKNACVSTGLRMGLAPSPAPEKPLSTAKKAKLGLTALPRFVPRVVAKEEPKPIGPQSDFPESNGCKFIHGFPSTGKWQCCGHPKRAGFQMCDFHCSISYQTHSKRPDKDVFRPSVRSVRFQSV